MTDDEFILFDRLQKIKSVLKQYGEENFSISFSGGKDSTVLSALVDMAAPDNKIPRVYSDTGIELNMVRDFVYDLQEHDDRICIIKPKVPIKPMLEKDGYPFKSKYHSRMVYAWWHKEKHAWARSYYECTNVWRERNCPKMLLYQFEQKPDFEISSFCCNRLKKEPLNKWQKESGRPYTMVGIMASEGGQRSTAKCMVFHKKNLWYFQPLAPLNKEWEDWFIESHNINICDIYKPPYNFPRTGCKGCPFIPNLQQELDILGEYFPAERRQCETIWAPVYAEYRRIKYRLDPQVKMEDLQWQR